MSDAFVHSSVGRVHCWRLSEGEKCQLSTVVPTWDVRLELSRPWPLPNRKRGGNKKPRKAFTDDLCVTNSAGLPTNAPSRWCRVAHCDFYPEESSLTSRLCLFIMKIVGSSGGRNEEEAPFGLHIWRQSLTSILDKCQFLIQLAAAVQSTAPFQAPLLLFNLRQGLLFPLPPPESDVPGWTADSPQRERVSRS